MSGDSAGDAKEGKEGGREEVVLAVSPAGAQIEEVEDEEEDEEEEEEREEPCYLYLVRDGRDACVSFYHHLKSMAGDDGGYEGGFDEFFEEWIEGRLPYGRWVDHVISWVGREGGKEEEEQQRRGIGGGGEGGKEGEREGRVLVVRYEELKSDLIGGLKRIARHCRISLRRRGRKGGREGGVEEENPTGKHERNQEEEEEEEEEEVWEAVRQKCSFEYMVENRQLFEPRSVTWTDPAFRFIRKGEVGGHKIHFTEEQLRRFGRAVKGRFEGGGGGGGGGEGGKVPGYVTWMLVGGEGSLDV